MYEKYQTDALILASRETGEADKVCALYTREFGLVRARASAVRAERSKMRYALQDLSRSHVGLVKGKRGWRLAGASAIESAPKGRALAPLARVAELVLRFVQGQEKSEYLFETLAGAHEALSSAREDAIDLLEIICVARILFALGYISAESLRTDLFTNAAFGETQVRAAEAMKTRLLDAINSAIAQTHL